jgi:hypothetical protein
LADSVEHIWPDWICRYFVDHKSDWSAEVQMHGSPLVAVEHFGPEVDLTTNQVCDKCNRGWMRKLEEKVSPFAKPMIDGNTIELTKRAAESPRPLGRQDGDGV